MGEGREGGAHDDQDVFALPCFAATISAKIDTATLADLYKQVAVDHKDARDVAAAWLRANGFVR